MLPKIDAGGDLRRHSDRGDRWCSRSGGRPVGSSSRARLRSARHGRSRCEPLLTPDHEGAVYSEAGARPDSVGARRACCSRSRTSACRQTRDQDRGFIDELIRALTQKLKTLDDARVLLRSGGSRFSAPAHAAWFFKSKGVDIDNRLRVIDDHHTKGMIVDGRRVLLGSHNWSKPGVIAQSRRVAAVRRRRGCDVLHRGVRDRLGACEPRAAEEVRQDGSGRARSRR